MYYGFGALNFVVPICETTVLILDYPIVSSWLVFAIDLLWIFTVSVLLVALIIIKRTLKDTKGRVAVNFKAMIVHFAAFAIYAA